MWVEFVAGFIIGCLVVVVKRLWNTRNTSTEAPEEVDAKNNPSSGYQEHKEEVVMVTPEFPQIYPKYYGYAGSWDKVTRCIECSSTGLYEDQHPTRPCKSCGGKVIQGMSGRWVSDKTLTSGGYWKVKGEIPPIA